MNGRRCKIIRAGFIREFGFAPPMTRRVSHNSYEPSAWRRLKKRYKEMRRKGALK